MELINITNLNRYIDGLADKLDWGVEYHAQIYREVAQQKDTIDALNILDNRIKHWFIRGGRMSPDWKLSTKIAANELKRLNYCLPDMAEDSKLKEVIEIIKPLGQIKRVRSGNENFMPASKILNFLFPELFPKIDTYWIKDICLRKVNNILARKRFITSGPTDLQQFREYLLFASEQDYNDVVIGALESILGINTPYAVAFEYCLLGYCHQEISEVLNRDKSQKMSKKTVSPASMNRNNNNQFDIPFHRNWLNHEELRLVFDQMREAIKMIGARLEENPVYSYVGYKFENQLVGWILVYRNSIEIGTYSAYENRQEVKLRVRSLRDDYSEIIKKMEKYYLFCVNG
ncbi:hypothetical protein ACFLV7_04145 [Chloroflexota bacterium]